jgi:hypothetical protein
MLDPGGIAAVGLDGSTVLAEGLAVPSVLAVDEETGFLSGVLSLEGGVEESASAKEVANVMIQT